MKPYTISQFGYCPLIWMFHSRGLNNIINSLHETALRITYCDRSSSFLILFIFKTCWKKIIGFLSIMTIYKLQRLTEMFSVKNNIAPEIIKELFSPKMNPYDLRNNNSFKRRRVNYVWHGTELVSCLSPKIWDLVPNEIKEYEFLNAFKFKIKRGIPEECPCRICKICLGQVGFITT